jgi:hypothetical protein
MNYGPNWVHPARTTEIGTCVGKNCVQEGLPPKRVMACTLSPEGLCAGCARTPEADEARVLR